MITYTTGDATRPVGDGLKIIAHICNDVGAWGAGFVLALSKLWPEPERAFRRSSPMRLGTHMLVEAEPDISVANMCAQRGIRTYRGTPPIRYEALELCLEEVGETAHHWKASLHMPRIGTGLAGGDWSIIEPIILRTCVDVPVTVYDLPKGVCS